MTATGSPTPLSPTATRLRQPAPAPRAAAPTRGGAPAPAAPGRSPDASAVARLSLAPVGSAPALLDGAWWPHSRDLTRELPPLIRALSERWGRITRVTVNPAHWPTIPRKVPVDGRLVKVGWFRGEQDPHQLLLLSRRVGRWDLLIVPPETAPGTAARMLAAGADPRRSATGSALLAEAERDAAAGLATPAADPSPEERAREAVWVAEGGGSGPSGDAWVRGAPVRGGDGRPAGEQAAATRRLPAPPDPEPVAGTATPARPGR
ncbi:DUF5994 family protein [Streptomyces buecherae]|uniref:Uncharacterized protein n=1 Tax=Streptomyces buecherae TaxID=2763006 RepID=A0A7H8N931_9ACTN|nr:DUF5994 family protein [Streptomyces buecherae]QKW50975.1 hypothetical protein HUT08_17140 [Streptomyces buecherae]